MAGLEGELGVRRVAEREAEHLARRFVDGRPLPRPRATLPRHHVAADVDWPGLGDLVTALIAFERHVARSRPYEYQTLHEAVSADGTVPADQVDLVVRTLAPLPQTACADSFPRRISDSSTTSSCSKVAV